MSTPSTVLGAPGSTSGTTRVVPKRAVGWWAIGLSVVGIAAWIILPVITTVFRESYPITNTTFMPIIGVVLVDAAAIFNALGLFLWKERSVLNIVAAAITIPAALLLTLMFVGEGIAGV
ncbi:hypothetical protein FDZ71_00235 [bacterium]|nr:MAG: hypothetical protein FDZ71_00235 [bacterium]